MNEAFKCGDPVTTPRGKAGWLIRTDGDRSYILIMDGDSLTPELDLRFALDHMIIAPSGGLKARDVAGSGDIYPEDLTIFNRIAEYSLVS